MAGRTTAAACAELPHLASTPRPLPELDYYAGVRQRVISALLLLRAASVPMLALYLRETEPRVCAALLGLLRGGEVESDLTPDGTVVYIAAALRPAVRPATTVVPSPWRLP